MFSPFLFHFFSPQSVSSVGSLAGDKHHEDAMDAAAKEEVDQNELPMVPPDAFGKDGGMEAVV
jgi:hypothetical protein